MTRDFTDRTISDRTTCKLSSLTTLLTATGLATLLACGLGGRDDDEDADATETGAGTLEPAVPGGPTPNGLAVPARVQDWGVVGAVARSDSGGQLRVIVGNEIAVRAARSGQTNPWPEGTMLSHFVWAAETNPHDDNGNTIGPGAFGALTLMVKNSEMYAADGGWAYGMWSGPELTPPDPGFDRACVNCHTERVSDKDYVFTNPGEIPDLATMGAAVAAPNGVTFPSRILDWGVIGVADIVDPMTPTLRVLVGNPTAVTAARSGQTNPWPDGSMISHIQWNAGTNPDIDGAVVPGSFRAFTVMQRSSALYTADGNWAYGAWATSALNPPAAADFDRNCVGCHTGSVSDRDMVFTEMAAFPPSMMPGATVTR